MPLLFERMKISKWDKYPQHERKSKIQKQYMKKRMFYPPLRDEFTKFGDKFEKIAHNDANGIYCYKRTTSTG